MASQENGSSLSRWFKPGLEIENPGLSLRLLPPVGAIQNPKKEPDRDQEQRRHHDTPTA
jgi:hypothetical protein